MIIKPNGGNVDTALSEASRQDQMVAELLRDFRQITPEVGSVIARLFGQAIDKSVRLPPGNRREIGMLALLIAGAAACAADILNHIEGGGLPETMDARVHSTTKAFEEMIKTGLSVQARKRLDSVMGSA